jgi:hypothetical protein
MTKCKHRWEPSSLGIEYRKPGEYLYECRRCGLFVFAELKGKS